MSNVLKTILYMGSLHGLLTVYLPYQLASHDKSVIGTGMFGYLAVPCWILGVLIILQCSADIIHRGRGTPSHFDPPRLLLLNGWYRRVRNPIYLGSLIVQGGYILWFGSSWVLIYAFLLFLGFQFLIVVIEEPILRNAFGAGYDEYCRRVPRWIPNFK